MSHGLTQAQGEEIYQEFYEAERTCTVPWVLGAANPLPGVSIKLHELMTILAAVAMIINSLLSLYLIWGHCFHWTKPMEQRQIVRLLVFIPFMSGCCLASIWSYPASGFVTPAGDYYEGFAITALFILYVQLVTQTSDHTQREQFFNKLERHWMNGKVKGNRGSLRWFRVLWALAFQVTIVQILTVAANEVLWSITCPLSPIRKPGYITIVVLQAVSTTLAVTACIIFERRMHPQLAPHKGTFKLFSFKILVGLSALQQILFSSLGQSKVFFPSPPYHVSYLDFTIGLPNFIFIWELTVVAFMFLKSFEFEPYLRAARSGTPVQASASKALLSSFNTTDIFYGLAYSFTGWHRHSDEYEMTDNDNSRFESDATAYQAKSLMRDEEA